MGACLSAGATSCVSGSVLNSCQAGTPTSDANCDGVDNDCDSSTDEHYVVTSTSCGLGVCASTGSKTCVSGSESDSCTAGAAAELLDLTCDGLDGDCDGSTDEDYVQVPSSCGLGVCASTGTTSCGGTSGVAQNCTVGTATEPAADLCNGLDGDCDGTVDEDFLSTPSSCGVGACASTGTTTCGGTSGVAQNCTAGSPTSEICDGIDNNCNSVTDEGIAPQACYTGAANTQGVGQCQGGLKSCTGGS